jgi:large subunit ribosomal protein L24
MKLFSPAWKSSSKAVKQRKYRLNSPLHAKREFVSVSLAPELRKRYGTRNITLRKGDTVKVLKGDFRSLIGKVNSIDIRRTEVYVDGAERVRKDGTKSFFPLEPSCLLITEVYVEDKMRNASLSRNVESRKQPAKGKGK